VIKRSDSVNIVGKDTTVRSHNVTRLNAGQSLSYNFARPATTYGISSSGASFLRVVAIDGEFTVSITNYAGASDAIQMKSTGGLSDLVLDGINMYTATIEETSTSANCAYILVAH
jgi:hypothetical protein